MWMLLLPGAWALDVTVCTSVCTYDSLADAAAAHEGEPQLTVRLLSDLVVSSTATFRDHDTLRFESGTGGPYLLRGGPTLAAAQPMVATVDVGLVTVDGLVVARTPQSPGAGFRFGGEAELLDVFVDDHQGGNQRLVQADGALTIEGLTVCAGRVDDAMVQATGVATVRDVVVEGLTGTGAMFDLGAGGSLEHVTVAAPGLAQALAADGADVQVEASALEAVQAVAATGGALVVVDRSGFRGATSGLSAAGLDLSVEPWWRADDAGHCGLDARPSPTGALWDATGDHVGGYHGAVPADGWDDDDEDGSGYGTDCDDGDPDRHPDADEVCDAVDMDCDGEPYGGRVPSGQGETTWPDADGDGLGAYGADAYAWCAGRVAEGWVANDDDCDDAVAGAQATTFHRDADGDGVPDADATTEACEAPNGYVLADGPPWDCDDLSSDVYPGAAEDCTRATFDNDCDGLLPEVDPDCDEGSTGGTNGGTSPTNGGTPGTNGGAGGPTTPTAPTAAAGGCTCTTGGRVGGLWLVALVGLRVRRRRAG